MRAALSPARWINGVVLLAVTGSLAAAAGPVAWHVLGWSGAVLPEVPRDEAAAPPPEMVDIAPILALEPFGREVEEAVPEAEAIAETGLDLQLRGIVYQGASGGSTAYISHDGRTQAYRIGDTVAERAEVADIAEDMVTLDVDGERQTLSFPDPDRDRDALADAEAEEAEDAGALSGPDRLLSMIVAGEARPEEDAGPPQTTQDHIALWRERIMANPGQVLESIGLEPTADGYRIAADHDSGVARAGLLAGDIVTSVNGQTVGNVDRDRQLFDDISASGFARLEIERDGQTIVMSFPLE